MINLKKWMTKVSESIKTLFKVPGIISISDATLVHCTGTLNTSALYMSISDGGLISICGRASITNFARTSNNPGFYFTLPSNIPTPTSTVMWPCGFRAESPREVVVFTVDSGTRTVYLTTNETYLNASGTTLTFIMSGVLPWN